MSYNSLLENVDPRLTVPPATGEPLRTRYSFLDTGRQFFVKFSYPLRF